MRAKLNCIQCFAADGKKRTAEFVVNGQSVCERHILSPVRDRGEGLYAYTYGTPDGPITLEPVPAP